jgi:hypothetical protein
MKKLLTILLFFPLLTLAQTQDALHPSPQNARLTLQETGAATITWEVPDTLSGVAFFEDFESGVIPEGWTLMDADGDGEQWEMHPADWSTPHSGLYSIASYSWFDGNALTPNNWIITPQITIPENGALRFFVSAISPTYSHEHYQVRLSTSGTSAGEFEEILLDETLEENNNTWQQRDIDLNQWAGQQVHIAFVHNEITDVFALKIDDIIISEAGTKDQSLESYQVYRSKEDSPASLLGTVDASTTFFNDTITDEGNYHYEIKALYNDGQSSEPAMTNTAKYIDWLPAPENVTATQTANLVYLIWAESTSQNKTLINESFEEPADLTNWLNHDFDNDEMSWETHTATGAYDGSQSVASYSWLDGVQIHPNNWLISETIPVKYAETLTLSYAISGIDANHSHEYYQVRVSNTGLDTTEFVTEFDETLPENDNSWKERSLTLENYIGDSINIGFVHQQITDIFGIKLDKIELQTTNSVINYNLYRKTSQSEASLIATLNGNIVNYTDTLAEAGEYTYMLEPVYSDGGQGAISSTETISFTSAQQANFRDLQIYPNPSCGNGINIRTSETIRTVEIFNSFGEKVYANDRINSNNYSMNLAIPEGIYIVNIKTTSAIYREKLYIKQK